MKDWHKLECGCWYIHITTQNSRLQSKNLITWPSIEAILQVYLVSFLAFLLLCLLRVWLVCQNP